MQPISTSQLLWEMAGQSVPVKPVPVTFGDFDHISFCIKRLKNFGEENGAPLKIMEEVAWHLETYKLALEVWKTDRENPD